MGRIREMQWRKDVWKKLSAKISRQFFSPDEANENFWIFATRIFKFFSIFRLWKIHVSFQISVSSFEKMKMAFNKKLVFPKKLFYRNGSVKLSTIKTSNNHKGKTNGKEEKMAVLVFNAFHSLTMTRSFKVSGNKSEVNKIEEGRSLTIKSDHLRERKK